MKNLIISVLLTIFSFTAFAQVGSQSVSGIKYRVNDTTTYQSAAATAHAQGYSDIFWNNQASTPHWDIWNGSSYDHVFDFGGGGSTGKVFPFSVTDEVIPITTGTSVISFRIPYAITLTGIRASLVTGQTSGSILTVDIKESGTTILSTLLTFDNGETTTVTATTPLVISDTSIADDAVITVDITQVGDGTGAGLKITLYGN